jgi:hypothetical protein
MLQPGVNPEQVAREHIGRFGGRLVQMYRTLGGYAAELTDAAAAEIAHDPRVSAIEHNREVFAFPPRVGLAPSCFSQSRVGFRVVAC